MPNDSVTPYESPSVEEVDTCGDPVKTSPMISIDS